MIDLFFYTHNCAKRANQIALSHENPEVYENFQNALFSALPSKSAGPSDVYVFAFQELVSIMDSMFPSEVDRLLKNLSTGLITIIKAKYGHSLDLELVSTASVGAIGLVLLSANKARFSEIRSLKSSCGMLGLSLKGACGLRFEYLCDSGLTETTVVACHLSAGEENTKRRNQDLIYLMRLLEFGDGYGVAKPNTHCFIMGDLNYRATTDVRHKQYNFEAVDELSIQRKAGCVFWGFEEAPVAFKPTYKFADDGEYNMKRLPSWCDRVLYLGYNQGEESGSRHKSVSEGSNVEILQYTSIPEVSYSDHKPVFLHIKVPEQAPRINLINSQGRVLLESLQKVYLKPTFADRYVFKGVTFLADSSIGYGLYGLTHPRGRLWLMMAMLLVSIYVKYG